MVASSDTLLLKKMLVREEVHCVIELSGGNNESTWNFCSTVPPPPGQQSEKKVIGDYLKFKDIVPAIVLGLLIRGD